MSELSINNGVNVNNVSFQHKKSDKTDNKPSDNKKMKKAAMYMVGATALAAAVVGGIMMHNAKAGKKVSEEVLNNFFGEVKNVKVLETGEINKIVKSLKKEGIIKKGDSMILIDRNERSKKMFQGFDEANVCMAVCRGERYIACGMMNVEEVSENIYKAFDKGNYYKINI